MFHREMSKYKQTIQTTEQPTTKNSNVNIMIIKEYLYVALKLQTDQITKPLYHSFSTSNLTRVTCHLSSGLPELGHTLHTMQKYSNAYNLYNIPLIQVVKPEVPDPTLTTIDGDVIDRRTDYLVSGFMREAQKLLPNTTIINTIPLLVNIECMKYYHCAEKFDFWGYRLSVNASKAIVSYATDNYDQKYNTIYGTTCFNGDSLYIYEWTFKIIGSAWGISIGITSSTNDRFDVFTPLTFTYNPSFYNAISNGGYQYCCYNQGKHEKIDTKYPESSGFKPGDIITMRVDVPQRKITYYLGGYDGTGYEQLHFYQNVVFETQGIFGPDHITYRMAISLGYPGGNVQLVKFRKLWSKYLDSWYRP